MLFFVLAIFPSIKLECVFVHKWLAAFEGISLYLAMNHQVHGSIWQVPKSCDFLKKNGSVTNIIRYFDKEKIWNASRICVSSLRRGHANLLCIVPILVYVLPKQAR